MLSGTSGRLRSCVLVDLNTQHDYFDVNGACPVVNALEKHACLRRIIAWARRNQVPIISSMDSHRSLEPGDNGRPRHCIEGTFGQKKLPFTVVPNHVFVAGDNTLSISIDLFRKHQQVIFPQRSVDLFANPKADRFLTQLRIGEFILFGAVAEYEIKAVALGLLLRNKRVTILTDGCGYWNPSECDLSFRQATAKGARLMTISELRQRRLPRRWKYTADRLIGIHRADGHLPAMNQPPLHDRPHL